MRIARHRTRRGFASVPPLCPAATLGDLRVYGWSRGACYFEAFTGEVQR